MKAPIRTAVAALVAAAAATAWSHGVSGRTDAVEAAASAARDALASDAPRAKLAAKVGALLARKSNDASLSNELRSMSAASRIAETRLADREELATAFDATVPGYLSDLASARTALAIAAASPQVKAKLRAKYQRALAKFDRFLPERAAAAAPRADTFAAYANAAAQAKGFTPYDSGASYLWVLSSLRTAASKQGVDLTGDGKPDNQFGAIQTLLTLFGGGFDLDQAFAGAVGQDGRYAMIEMWMVQDLAKADPFVLAGALGATDSDADPSNDLGGSGTFVADPATIAEDEHALVRVGTSLASGGKYRIDLTGQALALGGFDVPDGTLVVIEGTATASSNAGFIGMAIPKAQVIDILTAQGVDVSAFQAALTALADVDTDGDGTKDAISISLAFTSVPGTLVDPK